MTSTTTPSESLEPLTIEACADHLVRLAAAYFAMTTQKCPRNLLVLGDAAIIGGALPQLMIELGQHGATIVTAVGRTDGKPASGPEPEVVMLTRLYRELNPPPGSVSPMRTH